MRPTTSVSLVALAMVALAACGGGATSPLTDGTPATMTASETDPAGDADATTGTDEAAGPGAVDIDDFRFAPGSLSVAAGTEVTWTNQDATRHTVTAGSEDDPEPDDFDLEVDDQGDTVSTTFDEPGTYPYYCELHPFMTGTVEVTG